MPSRRRPGLGPGRDPRRSPKGREPGGRGPDKPAPRLLSIEPRCHQRPSRMQEGGRIAREGGTPSPRPMGATGGLGAQSSRGTARSNWPRVRKPALRRRWSRLGGFTTPGILRVRRQCNRPRRSPVLGLGWRMLRAGREDFCGPASQAAARPGWMDRCLRSWHQRAQGSNERELGEWLRSAPR